MSEYWRQSGCGGRDAAAMESDDDGIVAELRVLRVFVDLCAGELSDDQDFSTPDHRVQTLTRYTYPHIYKQ